MRLVELAGCALRGVLAAVAVAERQGLVGRLRRPAQCLGEARETLDGTQRGARLVQEPRPGGGEVDLAGRTFEQLHAEFGLELADPLRQGRRRHVQPGRRTAEVLLLGDGDEVGQPPQVHAADRSSRAPIMTR
jgi:hypothetical protein